MNGPTIRPAGANDRAAWCRLRFALWPDCPEEKHRIEAEQLLASDGLVLLAEAGAGEPIGFVEVSIRHEHITGVTTCPVPYLEGWYVDAGLRHQGVGRALLATVETWVREQGFTELASDTEIENARSIALHRELGFREEGRTVQFVKSIR